MCVHMDIRINGEREREREKKWTTRRVMIHVSIQGNTHDNMASPCCHYTVAPPCWPMWVYKAIHITHMSIKGNTNDTHEYTRQYKLQIWIYNTHDNMASPCCHYTVALPCLQIWVYKVIPMTNMSMKGNTKDTYEYTRQYTHHKYEYTRRYTLQHTSHVVIPTLQHTLQHTSHVVIPTLQHTLQHTSHVVNPHVYRG